MFLHPLGLLALLALPAVLALHLFRRRFRPHPVSALFLWAARDRLPVAGRRREPLHKSPSFWCEMLAALLAALALAGPRWPGVGEALHLVVVLDGSASMTADSPGAAQRDSAADRGRAEVEQRLAALPRGSRVTLVSSGARPRVLAGPAAFVEEARERLASYEPSAARHDLAPAVALATQLAGGGAVLLITDHFDDERWPETIEVLSLGHPLDNVAITHASRRRVATEEGRASHERVDLAVSNFGLGPVQVELVLSADGKQIERSPIDLDPDGRRHLAYLLPQGTPHVEARIPGDPLALDNVARLAPVPARTLALFSELPDELERSLGLEHWLEIVPDSIEAPDASSAHILLSREAPAAGASWCFTFEARGDERQPWIGPFLIDRRHALLEGLTLEGTVWNASGGRALPGAPLISAGNQPLLTEEIDGARRVFHADLDPIGSTLQRSPDWPILLANLAELRRRELPGPERTSLAMGESFRYHGRGPDRYRFEGPGTNLEIEGRSTIEIDTVERPGLYRLSNEQGTLCEVAYSFADAAESDLRQARPGQHAGTPSIQEILAGFSWPEMLLIGAVLALLAVDWWYLSRSRRRLPGAQAEVS